MNSPLTVRPAAAADFATVAALLADVYVGDGYSAPEIEPWLRDVAAHVAASDLLVAVNGDSGVLLGSVCYMAAGGSFAQIAQEGEAEFRLLAVAPLARGRGAGEALVRRCIDLARSNHCSRLVLSTQPTMAAARRLYERLGFVRAPDRDWQTEAGGNRIVYSLAL